MRRMWTALFGVLLMTGLLAVLPAGTGSAAPKDPVAAHWTGARVRAAQPRDLVLDERGLAYQRQANGTLVPYGHSAGQLYATPVATSKPTPAAKPTGEKIPPTIGTRDPAGGATITTSAYTFKATVTDASGVASVSFRIRPSGGVTQTFAAALGAGNVWSVNLSGFTNGSWSWEVVAKDKAKPANTATSSTTVFTVNTGGGGGGGGGTTVTNSAWTGGGTVQTAAGRILFEMPTNAAMTTWGGYVCSGTVATDATTGRSVIITAAHCVYDDVHKVFARNTIFIPNQDASTARTDWNCANDPIGCWTTSFGVVDQNWTTRTFPDNIPWDYAFYVVNDTGAHSAGYTASSDVLDSAAGNLTVQTATPPTTGVYTHALGYSYSDDPNFMYCAQNMTTNGAANWWLGSCDLSGGSSGGPWMQPVDGGNGPIVSVNSWGYTQSPGMAGPKLSGTSANCVFTLAKGQSFATVSNRGAVATC